MQGRIVVARGKEAFSFIYREHIDILCAMGEVTYVDPTTDTSLPDDTSLLYLPGGYPENVAKALSEAGSMLSSVRHYACHGGRVLAECGGMMYLCKSIITDDGQYPMCGVLPYHITARTADRRLSLGYRQMTIRGQHLRGHEFHYSQFVEAPESDIMVRDACGRVVSSPMIVQGNIIASYTHLYWGEARISELFLG